MYKIRLYSNTRKEGFRGVPDGRESSGNTVSMYLLGWLYDNGYGVEQDYGKAREWYQKAVDKGNERAMANLGWLYESGQGVAQDYVKAREWYEKAADKGDESAMTISACFTSTAGRGAGLRQGARVV